MCFARIFTAVNITDYTHCGFSSRCALLKIVKVVELFEAVEEKQKEALK